MECMTIFMELYDSEMLRTFLESINSAVDEKLNSSLFYSDNVDEKQSDAINLRLSLGNDTSNKDQQLIVNSFEYYFFLLLILREKWRQQSTICRPFIVLTNQIDA